MRLGATWSLQLQSTPTIVASAAVDKMSRSVFDSIVYAIPLLR
jgi:hypothetical protein